MSTKTELSEAEKCILIAGACKVDQWVIMKHGLYYRENAHGYTSCVAEAWKLTKAEAKKYEYPHDEPVTIHPCPIPDYFNDLNATHAAEGILDRIQAVRYFLELREAVHAPDPLRESGISEYCFHATASHRAEAFGKTLNLW